MANLKRMLARYEETCRKMHGSMMGRDFLRGVPLLERLHEMAREIIDSGAEGRESLFRMAEGEDLPVALNAAQVLYDHDPERCARALKAIVRRDDGFFAYAAGMMLKCRRKGAGAVLRDLRKRFFAPA